MKKRIIYLKEIFCRNLQQELLDLKDLVMQIQAEIQSGNPIASSEIAAPRPIKGSVTTQQAQQAQQTEVQVKKEAAKNAVNNTPSIVSQKLEEAQRNIDSMQTAFQEDLNSIHTQLNDLEQLVNNIIDKLKVGW